MDTSNNNQPQMQLEPVGLVRSGIKTVRLHAGASDLELREKMDRMREYQNEVNNTISELVISSQWAELLDGIEDFSHVLVLYWPHLLDPERRNLRKVHPMGRKDLPMQGIFATCSPARPNPVLVSAVRLLERNGNILKVKGLEAVDGSPIIDIKPYSKHYYSADNPAVPEWTDLIHREMAKIADTSGDCSSQPEPCGSESGPAKEVLDSEDFKQCVEFHGHLCPGVSIGYRMARAGMAWLKENRAGDEEVVAIVETDNCSADAVQVITGCTFGKGNFIYKDYGKTALTLFSRNTGLGVRVCQKPGALKTSGDHAALFRKVVQGEADKAEGERFKRLHFQRSCEVLTVPEDDLLLLSPVQMQPPPRARIEPSELCARCGEPAMPSKMVLVGGEKICRGCASREDTVSK